MRLTKRLSAFLIAVCLLVTMTLGATAATFKDVTDSNPYKDAIISLSSLGLIKGYTDGTFGPDKTITRAEFAAIITRALGLEEVALNASAMPIFNDMINAAGGEHWGSGYVKVAYDLGIVAGYGDGTFGPDNEVTYEQVVKMIVCTLGYGYLAEEKGGWPNGYLAQGSDIGVCKNAILTPTDQSAPRGLVAKLLYNSLEIKLMEQTRDNQYTISNKTLLADKLKVFKLTNALVADVEGNSLNPGSSVLREGEIYLEDANGGAVYLFEEVIETSEAHKLLGSTINGYYKFDEDLEKRVLVTVDTETTRNTTIEIGSEDVEHYSSSGVLSYWIDRDKDNKAKTINIADDAKLIYNGKAYDYKALGNSADMRNLTFWLSPNSDNFFYGNAKLLDSGSDGDVDVIFLNNFETYVSKESVKTNDPNEANNYVIYDTNIPGRNLKLDVDDRNLDITIMNAKTGSETTIKSIVANSVVSVAESMDQLKYVVYVSTEKVTGTISETSNSNSYFVIKNKEYELTPEYSMIMGSELDVDTKGTFYIDMKGRIAGGDVDVAVAGNYAYLTSASLGSGGVNSSPIVELFIPGNTLPERYRLATTVKINGQSYSAEEAIDIISDRADLISSNLDSEMSSTNNSQPVKYILNSSGRVSSLILAETDNGSIDIGINTNSGILKLGKAYDKIKYTSKDNFNNMVSMDKNTVVIAVPNDRAEDAGYKKINPSTYFKTGIEYDIEAWDMSKTDVAKLIIVYGEGAITPIDSETSISIITKISQKMSSIVDGSTVYYIEAYEDGDIKSYETMDTSSKFGSLQIGDIVRFGYNSDGQINDYEYSQRVNNIEPGKEEETSFDGGFRYKTITGTVFAITDSSIVIADSMVDENGDLDISGRETWQIEGDTIFYMIDLTKSSFEVTETNENVISEYGELENPNASKVFTYMYRNELKVVVVYILP